MSSNGIKNKVGILKVKKPSQIRFLFLITHHIFLNITRRKKKHKILLELNFQFSEFAVKMNQSQFALLKCQHIIGCFHEFLNDWIFSEMHSYNILKEVSFFPKLLADLGELL